MIKSVITVCTCMILLCSYAQTATVTNEPIEQASPPHVDTCAICLDPISNAKKLPCTHSFDTSCIQQWLDIQPSCPICKATVNAPLPRRNYDAHDLQGPYAHNYYYENTIDNFIITFDNDDSLSHERITALWQELIEIRAQAHIHDAW